MDFTKFSTNIFSVPGAHHEQGIWLSGHLNLHWCVSVFPELAWPSSMFQNYLIWIFLMGFAFYFMLILITQSIWCSHYIVTNFSFYLPKVYRKTFQNFENILFLIKHLLSKTNDTWLNQPLHDGWKWNLLSSPNLPAHSWHFSRSKSPPPTYIFSLLLL